MMARSGPSLARHVEAMRIALAERLSLAEARHRLIARRQADRLARRIARERAADRLTEEPAAQEESLAWWQRGDMA